MKPVRWSPLLLLLLLGACDAYDAAEYAPEYVVEAYLAAVEPLPQVRLSRTERIDAPYEFSRLAVRGADVRVHLLPPDGGREATYAFAMEPQRPGVYLPAGAATVQPGRTYELEVTFADRPDRITARTTVPQAIRLLGVNADTVVYQSGEQFELRVRKDLAAPRQGFYVFSTEALDARVEQLTPFARDLYERGDVTLEDLREQDSPIVNEANYDVEDDTTLVIRVPWLGILFYGPNRITVSTLDDNVYDFLRSQSVQQGGSTLSPGEIPNVLEHVEGGRGIFGSFARAAFEVYVAR